MWFVIHVKPGTEAQAVELLKASPKAGEVEEVSCPMSVGVRTGDGGDGEAEVLLPMLPGCVFVLALSKWELRACMRKAVGMQDLYDRDVSFEALYDDETAFIDALTQSATRTVDMSEGVVDGGKVVVRSGPLLGHEGYIRKYSGRCRWAYLGTSVAGKPASAQVGLRVKRARSLNEALTD